MFAGSNAARMLHRILHERYHTIILIIRNLVSIIKKWLRRQWTVENGTNSCSQRGILVQRKDLKCGSRHLTRKLTWAQGFRTSLGNTARGNDWSPHICMANRSRLTWIYITFPDPPPQPIHSQIYESACQRKMTMFGHHPASAGNSHMTKPLRGELFWPWRVLTIPDFQIHHVCFNWQPVL